MTDTIVPPGRYELDSARGRVQVNIFREGVLSKLGHDLVLEAHEWNGVIEVGVTPAESTIEVRVVIDSLIVREAQGGLRKLTTEDEANIATRIRETLSAKEHPTIVFRADGSGLSADKSRLDGTLAVAGRTEPLTLDFAAIELTDSVRVTGNAEVVQTRWGITPFKGLHFGLKVRDAVDLVFDVLIPTAEGA